MKAVLEAAASGVSFRDRLRLMQKAAVWELKDTNDDTYSKRSKCLFYCVWSRSWSRSRSWSKDVICSVFHLYCLILNSLSCICSIPFISMRVGWTEMLVSNYRLPQHHKDYSYSTNWPLFPSWREQLLHDSCIWQYLFYLCISDKSEIGIFSIHLKMTLSFLWLEIVHTVP